MKLKGNPIGWTLAVLVAATSLWFGSTSWRSSKFEDNSTILLSKKEKDNFKAPPIEYPTIRFTTVGATEQSYRAFIGELRTHLRTNDERYGIPVLRNRVGLPINQRFLLIELTNQDEQTVTLAMDVTNAYIVGYRAGNNAYFLRPDNQDIADAIARLFEGDQITRQTFTFDGSYGRLSGAASGGDEGGPTRNRENIELGMGPLEEAISALYLYATGETRVSRVAESFIISIQMIAEAVRFQYIEHEIARRIRLNQRTAPDASVLELENNWGALSTAIQESDQGTFAHNVQLQRRGGRAEDLFEVDNVMTVIRIIALMSYSCAPRRPFRSPLLLMPGTSNFDNSICVEHEPTVRIAGRNGLCVDVSNGWYNDGNPIILWQCKSNADENQLWTLKRDGTIQSNGKCLTTYGYSTGSYMMIYNCTTATTDATRWQVWENGTIINPISGLVLAATSGDKGITLSVESNVYAASQAWLPSMNPQPFVTSIVGLKDLCLQVNDEFVWLEECANGKAEQQWALYPDSSIRPQQNQDNCLTGEANVQDGIVRIRSCSSGSSGQRWMFKNDGTIWNLNSKLVLDVRSSDPSLKQIIMYTFTGTQTSNGYHSFDVLIIFPISSRVCLYSIKAQL